MTTETKSKISQVIWIPSSLFAKILEIKAKEMPEEPVNVFIVHLIRKYLESMDKINQIEELEVIKKQLEEKEKEIQDLKKQLERTKNQKINYIEIAKKIKQIIDTLKIDEETKNTITSKLSEELFSNFEQET